MNCFAFIVTVAVLITQDNIICTINSLLWTLTAVVLNHGFVFRLELLNDELAKICAQTQQIYYN